MSSRTVSMKERAMWGSIIFSTLSEDTEYSNLLSSDFSCGSRKMRLCSRNIKIRAYMPIAHCNV